MRERVQKTQNKHSNAKPVLLAGKCKDKLLQVAKIT